MSRFYRIVEQQVDIFVEICKNHIKDKNLNIDKIWVIKDQESSVVGIGDPDKLMHNKDFGFVFYYETIFNNLENAVDEFKFKLDHYIKVSNSTDRFPIFKDVKKSDSKS
jgi:hypothetical protein